MSFLPDSASGRVKARALCLEAGHANPRPSAILAARWLLTLAVGTLAATMPARGQLPAESGAGDTASQRADQLLNQPADPDLPAAGETVSDPDGATASVNLLQLIWTARWLMLPIILMSVLVVAVAVERFVSLRRRRVIPPGLLEQVWQSTEARATFSPRGLQQAAQDFPSPTATVLQALLGKLGRPSGDLERAVSETMQRESERLYRPVRSLNLAAAVAPLLGLLGTVWGMIEAFFATANLPIGANKAESLAEGIYTALVTTAGGLVVAIPAAILAHYFEGQIQKVFHEIHELVYDRLIPKLEQVEERASAARTVLPATPKPPTPPPVVTRG